MRFTPRVPGLLILCLSTLLIGSGYRTASAEELARRIDEIPMKQPLIRSVIPAHSGFPTTQADTVWVGCVPGNRSPSNPYGVGIGGVWEFDSGISGTDSTQFWSFYLNHWRSESNTALPTPADRPMWYFDHGNEVNIGDTNLWLDREARGMHAQNTGPAHTAGYMRTGITGYWHVDDMTGVSSPLVGVSSAWCGLRGPSDFSQLDPVTGNPLNGDLARYWTFGGAAINGSWPGYGNQIEQILYRDIVLTHGDGSDLLSFRFRTDMSDLAATENGGSAWFNPDPTVGSNMVLNPIDSLMVWVGLPQEDAYDVNKRWLSEVIDFGAGSQPVKLFAQHGKAPLVGNDSTVTANLPAWGPGTTVRIALQVKTNREYADETYDLHGFDSVEGAALVDEVTHNAAVIGDFEAPGSIRPRYSLPGGGVSVENDPALYWITTGKPPAGYGHIHNVFDLPYDDPCGALGAPDRVCDLIGNVILLSNHDDPDHAFFRESWVGAESPTIPLYDGSPIQNALDAQGFELFRLEYQLWTGTMDLDQSVFWNVGARYHGPTFLQQADNLVPGWSDNIVAPFISFNPDPACVVFNSDTDLDGPIPPPSALDSMKVFVWTQTRCARFGATVLCGKPEGGYFDNIRAGFTGGEGAAITAQFWNLLADTFPFNEDIAPGTADFDTTTALIKQGLNNAASSGGEGVIIGDTLAVDSPFLSPGGLDTRVDILFRVFPGPGNYSDPGNMGSPLIEKAPSHPFWATYSADPGPFSKGPHPGRWLGSDDLELRSHGQRRQWQHLTLGWS